MDVLRLEDAEKRREDEQCIKDHIVNMDAGDPVNVGGVNQDLDFSK